MASGGSFGSGTWTTKSSAVAQSHRLAAIVSNRALEEPPFWPKLFAQAEPPRDQSYMDFGSYAELGLLQPKFEGAPPAFDLPLELIPSHAEFQTFALMTSVSHEAQYEDPYDMMGKAAPMLVDSERVTEDTYIHSVINFGFDPDFPMSDGQPLFSANHLLAPIPGGAGPMSAINQTYSNLIGNVAPTAESLQDALLNMSLLRSDRGLPSNRIPLYFVVHPFLEKVAKEIVGSVNAPSSADNRTNVQYGVQEVIADQYLTNPYAWYLSASPQGVDPKSGQSLIVSFQFRNHLRAWFEPATLSWNIAIRFRALWLARDWRGLNASAGAGPYSV
jgi:hypothetical protein